MDPLDALEPLAPQDPQPQQDPKPSPASQSENPYVRLLQEQDEQAEQLAIEAFHAAVKADPAKAREADRIARKLGMPDATLAERKPEEVRRMLAQREWDYHRSAVYSPTLRQQMSDPRFARMAHDDTANLSAYHRIGFAMERGRLIDERGRIGGRMLVGGNSEADIRRLAQINQRMGEIPDVSGWDPVGIVAGAAGIAAQMSSSAVESLAVGATAAAPLVMTGPAGPVTVPVAFTAGAVGMMGARAAEMEAGNFYADMIASGYGDTWQARAGAAAVGIINGALEMGGMSAVSKPVRDVLNRSVRQQISEGLVRPTMSAAAKRLAKNYILGVGAETGTEVLQEVTNIVAEGAVTGKWEEDVAGRLGKIASETAQGMLLLGAPGPIFRAAHDVSEARAALQQQQRFRQRMQAAAESKLRKENPEAFQDAVAQASDQTLYLNAKDMAEALTQRDEADNAANTDPNSSKKRLIEQIDGLFPGLRERIGEAMVRGGDVTMQASEFAAKLSGTPVGQALEKIVRFDPNGMSAAEAAKIDPEKLADEAIKEAEQQQASDAQWEDEAKAVEAGVYEQLLATGKMKAREAKANAATWRKFVEVQAAEEGLTPKQFADEYALSVKAGEVGPDAMAQGNERPVRGGFMWRDGKPIIALTKDMNESTFTHELGHAFLSIVGDLAARKTRPKVVDDFNTLLKWFGVKDVATWQAMNVDQQRAHHERFAREFEAWMWEGKEPASGLKALFVRLMKFMRSVYNSWQEITGGERAPDEVREVMARMLASERDVAVAQAIRGAVPQFQTQEESGLDDEAWAKHVERQRAADEAAINELARNDLRNMRWLSGEKAKRLRQMDREADRVRTGERNRVAAEVEQRPVYRAQRWLKTGEFINPDGTKTTDGGAHKLSREAVRELLGLRELDEAADPKPAKEAAVKLGPSLVTRIKQLGGISTESWNKTFPGERKKEWRIPFMVRASGMSWKAMASQLRSEGYGPEKVGLDGEGSGDNSWLVDALSEHAQGVPQYSRFTMDQLAQMREPDTRAPETDAERADRLEAERLDAEQERARAAAIQVAKPELAVDKLRGMLAKDGYAPDDVATVFGFKTGEQMVREIIEAPALEAAIEQATDAVMMEKHTDLIDPDKRERSIERALHSEARRRFIASELAALSSAAEEPVRVTMAAAKKAAEVAIAKKKVGEIRASSFAMAARRASKDSVAAMKAGETQQAIDAKRRQLRLEAIADLAVDAEVEIEKGRSFMGKFFGKDADLAKRLDIDFVRAGRALAAAYGFGPKVDGAQQQELTAKALERITEEWPAVAERVVPLLTEASRNGISHNVITVEWFREVVATGEMLWKVAGDAAELVAEEKRKKVSEAVGALSQQIASLPPPPTTKEAPAGQTPSPWRRTMLGFWSALAGLKVAEHWAHWMDGGKQGPFFRYIIAPVMRAADRMRTAESSILREVHREYMAAVDRNGAAWTARIYSDELDFTFRGKAELLHAILHTGSESGLRKFLLGERGANGVPLADLTYDEEGGEVVDTSRWERFIASKWRDGTLTKDDAAFLRFMWGQFAKLLPEAQATHRKLYGHEFKTIEHRQILTPFGVLDGGYVPARVDTAKAKFSKRYNSMSDMEKAAESFRYSVGPAKGFTKERSELYRQPLSLDMTKLLAHMSEEVRFVYLGPAVQDVLRILNGKMQVVDEAGVAREVRFSDVLGAYDREAKDGILMPWLQNTALQQTTRPGLSKFGDAAAKTLRSVASLGALGFDLSNSLLQLTGISTAATQVKGSFVRSGLLHFVKNPAAAVREMMAASPAMAQRYDQQSRLLMQQIERTAMNPVLAARDVAKKALARWAFLPQRLFQMAVDTVVWHGARAQAAAMDMSDADAVEAADAAVRRSQGNPNPEGKARYAVATPFVQLFTQFGDYSNNMLNVIMASQGKSRAVLWALVIPAVIEGALRMMLRPPEDDDGDGLADEVAWGMGKSLARSATGMVPLVGPFMFTLADSEGQRVMESPASGVLKELYQSTLRIMDDEDSGEAEVRAWANLLTAMGFPVSAPVRLAQTISADR